MLEQYRRELHLIPEIGFQEFETKSYLYDHVKKTSGILHEVGETGIIIFYDNGKDKTIGFRADIDGLPITEETDHDFVSQHSGFMHACGHDGHMAMVLGIFDYLEKHVHKLEKNIVLVFQPSEEALGGSQSIIDSGLLQKYSVSEFYGFHLWPGLPKGNVFSKGKELMSQASDVNITVHGKSMHIAERRKGVDALQVACRLLNAIYDYEETIDPTVDHLLKFGQMGAGTVRNVIASEAKVYGTIRSYDNHVHQEMKLALEKIVEVSQEKFQCQITLNYKDGCDAVINDEKLFSKLSQELGIHPLEKPVMQSEDFGNYTSFIPSVFSFLGIGNTPSLHESTFDFDSRVLYKGFDFYKNILYLK
ncbi:amidohydrolase [Vagococcus elongatus]|uniref:Peptidase M20 n=1 Tax=Vagococcus elongatus TaxID=180344 RepID=A0A430AQB0_9ENTE|nr:amidohydrolase [Vagococcus elongatus]RSU10308.1 peptidase M20 [Vagococcus elongatus]